MLAYWFGEHRGGRMTPGLSERHPLKEKRRANKPLLERKRRAKINDSLLDLKTLVLSSLNKDVSKYAKMEKVDILDMAVRYLKGKPVDEHLSFYRAGYADCMQNVCRVIMSMEELDFSHKYKLRSKISEELHPNGSHLSPPPSPNGFFQPPPQPPPSAFANHMRAAPLPPCAAPVLRPYADEKPLLRTTEDTNKCPDGPLQSPHGHCLPRLQSIPEQGRLSDDFFHCDLPEGGSKGGFNVANEVNRNEHSVTRKTELYINEKMEPIIGQDGIIPYKKMDYITKKNNELYCSEQLKSLQGKNPVCANREAGKESVRNLPMLIDTKIHGNNVYVEEKQMGKVTSNVWRPW